jgi:hypothetical protein
MGNDFKPSHFKTFMLIILGIVNIVTYPIRKPLVGVILVIVLLGAPTLNGVPPRDVISWYGVKLKPVLRPFVNYKNSFSKHTKPIQDSVGQAVGVVADVAKKVRDGQNVNISSLTDTIASQRAKQPSENKRFSDVAKQIEDKKNYSLKQKASKKSKAKIRNEKNKNKFAILQKRRKATALPKNNYMQEKPQANILDKDVDDILEDAQYNVLNLTKDDFVKGEVRFLSNGNLRINDQIIALYGIKVFSASDAVEFLQSITGDDIVECDIVSIIDNTPQGICSAGGLEFNQMLVDAQMAKEIKG